MTRNPFAYGFILMLGIPITLGSFVLPLYSTHSRMVEEKERLEADVRQRIQVALRAVHDHMDGAAKETAIPGGAGPRDFLGALLMGDEYIRKAPTWPWDSNTFRTLLAALLLPMVIFV